MVLSRAFSDKANTLRAGAGAPKHIADITGRIVCPKKIDNVLYDPSHRGDVIRIYNDVAPTLSARAGTGGHNLPLHLEESIYCLQGNMIGRDVKNGPQGCGYQKNISYTQNTIDRHAVVSEKFRARRLTPIECERLQGLPDNYTNVPGATDAKRYEALGNGMAQPCADFIIQSIVNELKQR